MISAKQAKSATTKALEALSSPLVNLSFLSTLEKLVGKEIEEASNCGCDTVEVKYQHEPSEVNTTVLLVNELRALGYYAKSYFNPYCTESKIVIGWRE